MNTALRIAPQIRTSRRVPLLGAISAAVAAASIAVTLAVAGGGSDTTSRPSGEPATATPDRATLYQRGVESPQPSEPLNGRRAAERFHHFR